MDSGSPVNITNKEEQAQLTLGPDIKLGGILEGTASAAPAEVEFPTYDSNLQPVVIKAKGKGLFFKGASSKILSLSILLKNGFLVHFEVG